MAKLLTILNLIMLPKGHNYHFNAFLHSDEVDCRCNRNTCHYTLVNPMLIQYFYEIRLEMTRPLVVTSLFRCQEHNSSDEVGGVPHSSHTTGNAIDISLNGLSGLEKSNLIDLFNDKFIYTKIYRNFIHCQLNP